MKPISAIHKLFFSTKAKKITSFLVFVIIISLMLIGTAFALNDDENKDPAAEFDPETVTAELKDTLFSDYYGVAIDCNVTSVNNSSEFEFSVTITNNNDFPVRDVKAGISFSDDTLSIINGAIESPVNLAAGESRTFILSAKAENNSAADSAEPHNMTLFIFIGIGVAAVACAVFFLIRRLIKKRSLMNKVVALFLCVGVLAHFLAITGAVSAMDFLDAENKINSNENVVIKSYSKEEIISVNNTSYVVSCNVEYIYHNPIRNISLNTDEFRFNSLNDKYYLQKSNVEIRGIFSSGISPVSLNVYQKSANNNESRTAIAYIENNMWSIGSTDLYEGDNTFLFAATYENGNVEVYAVIIENTEKDGSNIYIDFSDFIFDAGENQYYVNCPVDKISGHITTTTEIEKIEFRLSDENGTIWTCGDVSASSEFSIPTGLMPGINTFSIDVTLKNGYVLSETINLYNINMDNILNIDLDENDIDEDGLPNYVETYYKTNINNADTDGDGLSDYFEVIMLGTDPLVIDTDGNGINDGNEDADGDGITNLEEISIYFTNPLLSDSDEDSLTDGAEIFIYHTYPNDYDTDDDGRDDGFEIANGFDPLTAEEEVEYTIYVNGIESGITLKSNNTKITASSRNDDPIINSEAAGYMGKDPILVKLPADASAVISIDFNDIMQSTQSTDEQSNEVDENDPEVLYSSYSNEAEDEDESVIPTIFLYDEETQQLIPQETIVENGVAHAEVTQSGIYVLLNFKAISDIWNDDIFAPSTVEEGGKIDIVFVIDYSYSMNDNDPNRIRMKVTKEFIDKLRPDIRYSSSDKE